MIRGGENIYPREIEEFLVHASGGRAGVGGRRARPKYGEELCAWIKLKSGPDSTEEEIRELLPRAAWPTTKCRATSSSSTAFPQTVTGKIQKFKIREAMRDELGLSEQATA